MFLGKFIAFKTFLDEKFQSQVPVENSFQYPMLKSYVVGNKVNTKLRSLMYVLIIFLKQFISYTNI